MARSISDQHKIGAFTLQTFRDSEDPFIPLFKIERKEILYGDARLLNINIFNDVNDYAIIWKGYISCTDLISVATKADENISRRATQEGISGSEKYTAHIFLPGKSWEEQLKLPFDMLYFDGLDKQGMTFFRLDTPYFDVTTDLNLSQQEIFEGGGEVSWTSFYQTPEETIDFFLRTIRNELRARYDRSNLINILSMALSQFRRV